jgi:hypothetical protein
MFVEAFSTRWTLTVTDMQSERGRGAKERSSSSGLSPLGKSFLRKTRLNGRLSHECAIYCVQAKFFSLFFVLLYFFFPM